MSPRDAVENINDPALKYWAYEISKQVTQLQADLKEQGEQNQAILLKLGIIEAQTLTEKKINRAWIAAIWAGLTALAGLGGALVSQYIGGGKP